MNGDRDVPRRAEGSNGPRTTRASQPPPNRRARPPSWGRLLALMRRLQAAHARVRAALSPIDGSPDDVLWCTVVTLIVLGAVMVYSASHPRALVQSHSGDHYFVHHVGYAAMGIAICTLLERVDYHYCRLYARPAIVAATLALVPLAFGWGHGAHGSVRWLQIGPVRFQPVELAKLAFVVYLSDSLARKRGRLRDFSFGFLPYLLVACALVFLCMKQPDFGSSVFLLCMACTLPWVAGTKTGYVLASLAVAAPGALAFVLYSPYRSMRVAAWLASALRCGSDAPDASSPICAWIADVESVSTQADVALSCFARGGVFGMGLGDGHEKLGYLPEPFTDFIIAVVAEELGVVGFAALLAGYALIIVRGILAARRAVDAFGFHLATGVTLYFGLQAVTNVCVVLSLAPTKGLVAPLLSLGGTAMTCNCAALGMLLNVARRRVVDDPGRSLEPGPVARSDVRFVGDRSAPSADDSATRTAAGGATG